MERPGVKSRAFLWVTIKNDLTIRELRTLSLIDEAWFLGLTFKQEKGFLYSLNDS